MPPNNYAQLLYEILENKPAEQQEKILDNFKKILIKNKETHLAPAIHREFEKIQERKRREKTVYIASATELNKKQKQELENMWDKPREFSVNPDLLGGIAVRRRDTVYNATVRKKIELLRNIF
jgi:ATP synthase F1 delta subunit